MDILIPIRLVLKKQEIYFRIRLFLARRIITCYSKKQLIIVLFSTKTKYYALYKIVQEVVWLR
jgi:hypothetical protein